MTDMIAQHRAYLHRAVDFCGLSPTALARKAGVAQTTVTRLYFNRPPVFALNATSLAKIEKASGLPFSIVSEPPKRFLEAEPYVPDESDPLAALAKAALTGSNGFSSWVMLSRALEGASIVSGDILLVDMSVAPERGDVVCAQIGDAPSPEDNETIFRVYEPPYLVAQTPVGDLRAPLPVDNKTVSVRGVVIAVIRPRYVRDAA